MWESLLGGAALGGINSLLGMVGSAVDAAEQYHYAKKMYKHRYQWAMQDMQKAGLNPVLAANGGNVSGMSSAPSTDFSGAVQNGVNSAMATAKTLSDIKAQQVTNAKTSADASLVQSKKAEQDIRNVQLPKTVRAQAFKAEAEASLANSASVIQRARTEFADQLAKNEEVKSYNDAVGSKYRNLGDFWDYQHNKKDFYARPSASEERNWWRAKKILDSVGSGVGSAVGVGRFMRYMRYFR